VRGRVLAVIAVGLATGPYLKWAWVPSLFDDDLTRVGGLRRFAFPAALFRPFNEHLAPLFELVGWLAWWGSGRRVEAIAGGFLVASYLAWGATLTVLGAVVRLELRSGLAGLVAVVWFGLSTVAAETVLWYSASSFQWAAAASLATWYATTRAIRSPSESGRGWWLVAAAVVAAAGPMFSAIGVLAGPLASLRWLLGKPRRDRGFTWRVWLGQATVPLGGTLVYAILIAANPYHGAAVSASVRHNLDLAASLQAMLVAPGAVLVPMMVGLPSLAGWFPDRWAVSLTLGLLGGVLVWAWRSPDRGLLVLGLGWVVGGYLLAYSVRAVAGDRFILEVGRYHLFPAVGVICWGAAVVRPILNRLEARTPLAGIGLLLALAAVGFVGQGAKIDQAARRSFRWPDQPRAIAAALRLEAICRAEQIPLSQAIRIIDPTEPRWFPRPLPFHPSLYLFGSGLESPRQADADARSALIGRLTPDDRATIFGGLDAARYRAAESDLPGDSTHLRLEIAARGMMTQPGGGQTHYEEFRLPPDAGEVISLDIAGITPGTRLEVWWAGLDETWTTDRSIRWTSGAASQPVRVARLPHWRPGFAHQFRVVRQGRSFAATDHPVLDLRTRRD